MDHPDLIVCSCMENSFGQKRVKVNEYVSKNYFPYFSTKTYVMGTQKNRLNETVLLGTRNTC